MSTYLLINLLIIAFPVLFSFERQARFIRQLPHVAKAIALVSPAFIIWDGIATARGDWGFAEQHITGITFYGLPLEELLFFVTVPYALLFTHEAIGVYLPEKKLAVNAKWFTAAGIILAVAAVAAIQLYYTATVFAFSAAFFLSAPWLFPGMLQRRSFWITMAVTYIPFFVVNYILTSLPVVWYSDGSFSGLRITTIPAEDIFYCFSMTAFWLSVYLWSKEKHAAP